LGQRPWRDLPYEFITDKDGKGPLDGIEELIPVPDRPVKGGKRDGTITVARRAMPLALSVPEISQAGVPPLTLLLQCSMSNIPQCSACPHQPTPKETIMAQTARNEAEKATDNVACTAPGFSDTRRTTRPNFDSRPAAP
jgi:hypothetical protein